MSQQIAEEQEEEQGEKKATVDAILYNTHPDYEKPALDFSPDHYEDILNRLSRLYGIGEAKAYMPEIERILRVHYAHKPEEMIEREKSFVSEERFTEKDIILITYGDLIRGRERSPLATLAKFCRTYLEGTINTLHLLPFFPYSSDRGFSVIDPIGNSVYIYSDREPSEEFKQYYKG